MSPICVSRILQLFDRHGTAAERISNEVLHVSAGAWRDRSDVERRIAGAELREESLVQCTCAFCALFSMTIGSGSPLLAHDSARKSARISVARSLLDSRLVKARYAIGILAAAVIAAACSDPGGGDCADAAPPPACGVDTWASFGEAFFASHCSQCHSFDRDAVQGSASSYASALSSGAMPRGGGLSSCDRARAVTYLQCGAP